MGKGGWQGKLVELLWYGCSAAILNYACCIASHYHHIMLLLAMPRCWSREGKEAAYSQQDQQGQVKRR